MRYDTQQDYDDRQRLDADEAPAEHPAQQSDVDRAEPEPVEPDHNPEAGHTRDVEHTPDAEHPADYAADTEHRADTEYPADTEHRADTQYPADTRYPADTEDSVDADHPVDAEHAAEAEPAVGAAPVPPPAVTATDIDTAALWPEDTVHDLQQRFREVQWRFVDDPRAAADEAHALVTEAVDQFSATIESRKRDLDGWRDTDDGDTEQMRMVVRRYRNLLDRLLGV